MATCKISLGIEDQCGTFLGGIARVLLANAEDVTTITETSKTVTAITMASTTQFFEVKSLPTTGNGFTAVGTGERKGVQEALTVVVAGDDALKAAFFDEIVGGAKLVAIVLTGAGEWRMLGRRADNEFYRPLKHVGTGDGNASGNADEAYNPG